MLLRHGVIVLAIAAIAGGAGLASRSGEDPESTTPYATSVSTALNVSRRSDPSIDRYTRSRRRATPLSRLTSAQKWISAHASPFVANDSDPTVSLNIVGWATKPDVHAYINAAGPNAYNHEAVRDASRWLVRSGKTIVRVDDWLMLDMRQPAARHWWLYGSDNRVSCNPDRDRRGALDLIACGYTGLWVDNILTQPAQWYKPNPHIDPRQWGDAEVALLQELRAALPARVPFTINAHWTDSDFPYMATPALDPSSALVRAAQTAGQLVMEGGAIDRGINYGGALGDQWSYPRLLAYVDAMHAQGVRVQWEKTGSVDLTATATATLGRAPSCRDVDYHRQPAWRTGSPAYRANVRTSGFNLASALLTFAQGDSVGDLCEYPGRGFAAYGHDLGAPVGARTTAGPVTVRQFANGLVAVNPSLTAQTVTLPDGKVAIDLARTTANPSVTPAASFVVQPRTALIAQYPALAPSTP